MTVTRRHFKQTQCLEERLANEAMRLKTRADLLPPGPDQEAALKKARQADTASHIIEWLRSPGLRPPE
jgi:hypothetical protein